MASTRIIMPSSPPILARGHDFISRLATEADSDDDLDASLDHYLSDIRSEDIDGPTDFTANLTQWMRHTQPQEPKTHTISVNTEDEALDTKTIDGRDEEVADYLDNETQEKVHDRPNTDLAGDDLDSDDELSSLLKELDSFEQEDQNNVDRKQPYQAFVEDGSDMPLMLVANRVPPPESDSHATSTRPASSLSTADEVQPAGSETSVSTLHDEKSEPAITTPIVAQSSGILASNSQISQLLESVQSLQAQLAQSMQALTSQMGAQKAANDGQNDIASILSSLQTQNRRDQEPVLTAVVAMQEQMTQANAAVLTKFDRQIELYSQIDTERLQREREQTAQIERLKLELEDARRETATLRGVNSQLTTRLNEVIQDNQVLEKDRVLMSRVLLDQWGREECGASQPQKYRYKTEHHVP